MTDFNSLRYGFIGLGLIGGSIARAIRRYWPDSYICAYNPSKDSLKEAAESGIINEGRSFEDTAPGHLFPGDLFDECDIIFLCAPVKDNAANLLEIRPHLKPGAILTDIGSTKRDIHEHVAAAGLQKYFVGGHPMTGSERTRFRNSSAALLENAYYILSPEENADPRIADTMKAFVEGIHAIPLVVPCRFHDYAVAGISHLPHVIAASLVNLVKKSDNDSQIMKQIAAGGFKDITRIASSSPEMWQQICLTNKDNIVSLLDDYMDLLGKARDSIASGDRDRLYSLFGDARDYRDSFTETGSGAHNRLHIIHVDIEDHPASLAEVVTLLAVNAISIKNIAITHNREYQEGVLRVEFYTDAARQAAAEILSQRNYVIHLS